MTNEQLNAHDLQAKREESNAATKRFIAAALDEYQLEKSTFIALRGEMGQLKTGNGKVVKTTSYTVVHGLDWIGQNIQMGSEMPLMKSMIDEKTGALIINEDNAEEIMQRAPDWTRQMPLTIYLAADKNRKFGSLLSVITPNWVDDPYHDNWGSDGRALRNAFDFESLDSSGNVGLLKLTNSVVYALDGQHRVMGIKGLQELRSLPLSHKNKGGLPKGTSESKASLIEKYNLDINFVEKVLAEKMTVEYIPAVIAGETREEARRRVRDVFLNINKTAKTPDKGELILMSETDGYSIVARKVGLSHSLFKRDKKGDRINWKTATVAERSMVYTTLQHLKTMSKIILDANDKVSEGNRENRWQPLLKDQVPVRPEEYEIDEAIKEMITYFDHLQELPTFKGLNNSKDKDLIATRAHKFKSGKEEKEGKNHLLLRPIGQITLANAVATLIEKHKLDLDTIFEKLKILDKSGKFEASKPSNLWYGVTFDPLTGKMEKKYQDSLAPDILVYLLVGASSKERESLIKRIVPLREREENTWVNFSGQVEPIDYRNIDLPSPV